MDNYFVKLIKEMHGSLLGIGIDSDRVRSAVENNENIKICNFLDEGSRGFNKKKFLVRNKPRKVNIKKLRRVFKKKRVDNIICDLNVVCDFLKFFVRDSVYICKGKIYIYGDKIDDVKLRYERYTDDIKVDKVDGRCVLVVNCECARQSRFKDFCYWIQDTFNSFLDILTNLLAN